MKRKTGEAMLNRVVRSDTVIINAPKQKVWEIMTDIESYSQWNPFTPKIDGVLELGTSLGLHVKMPKRGDRIQIEKLKIMHHSEIGVSNLAWGMTMVTPVLLVALREQILESKVSDTCSYYSTDSFSGVLSPLVYSLFYEDIKQGFDAVAYALKARAEEIFDTE